MICISTILDHLISVVYELSVLIMVESYFRCAVRNIFTILRPASHIWLCDAWARWFQHSCSIVDFASEVIAWFSDSGHYRPNFMVDQMQAIDGYNSAFYLRYLETCLSNMGKNLFHSNYTGSFHTFHLLLSYWALLLTSLITSPYTLLIWAGFMELIFYTVP